MNSLKKKHVLITGGSGLVGINLTKLLLSKNRYKITVVDLVPPKNKGINFIKADFANAKIMLPLLKRTDYLIHLAAMVGVDNCRLHPKKVYQVNYINTKKIIDWAIKSGIKKIVFSSSSEVYGNSKAIPFKEDTTLFPISDYAKYKLLIEQYLKKMTQKNGFKVSIIRFFNVYGPGQKDMVIPLFADSAAKDKPLTVLGDGTQTRCFIYVEDAALGLYKTLIYNKSNYEIFNIGGEQEIKIKDLAKLILEKNPTSKSKIVYVPYGGKYRDKKLEIYRRVPDIRKAKSLLAFKTKVDLKQGIKKLEQGVESPYE